MKTILIITSMFLLASCTANEQEINATKGHEKKVVEARVTDKTVKRYDKQDKYLIYTDKGTFEVTDSLLNWQFNSSDIYGYIEKDKCYEFGIDAFSVRASLLSMYENIVSARKIDCK